MGLVRSFLGKRESWNMLREELLLGPKPDVFKVPNRCYESYALVSIGDARMLHICCFYRVQIVIEVG